MHLNRTVALLTLMTLPMAAQTTTTARPRTAARTHSSAHAHATATATPEPGTTAVGEMPGVTGKVDTLYSLKYVDITVGTGELAQPQKYYTVHYTGWTLDGKKFDSSHDHPGGEPFTFPAGAKRVITGWDTGFDGMRIGGKRRLIVPYQLAYGVLGHEPVIPAKATLIFDVEFLAQGDTPPAPKPMPEPAK